MNTTQPTTPLFILASRTYWMLLGPMLLIIPLVSIIRTGEGWFTAADVTFLIILAALPLARWLEFQGADPQTSTGERATAAQLHRYMIIATIVGLGAWVIANLLGNHWLTG